MGWCTYYFIQSTFKASFKQIGKSTRSTQEHHQKPIQYVIRTRYLNTSDKFLCSECIQKFFLRECSDMKRKFETSNARLICSKLVPSPFKEHILKNLSLAIWTSVIRLKAFHTIFGVFTNIYKFILFSQLKVGFWETSLHVFSLILYVSSWAASLLKLVFKS